MKVQAHSEIVKGKRIHFVEVPDLWFKLLDFKKGDILVATIDNGKLVYCKEKQK